MPARRSPSPLHAPRLAVTYHAVSDAWRDGLSVDEAVFRAHVERLHDAGYTAVTLSELAARPRARGLLAITFDDGFASVRTRALPVLADAGWPATVFLTTRAVGDGVPMDWIVGGDRDPATARERLPLAWADAQALAEAGWEVGSHTRTHRLLARLDERELRDELAGSREEIVAALGACGAISYPWGVADARSVAAARAAGYTAGCGLEGRFSRGDAMAVPRVVIGRADDGRRFRVKTSAPFWALRSTPLWELLQRARRRGEHGSGYEPGTSA